MVIDAYGTLYFSVYNYNRIRSILIPSVSGGLTPSPTIAPSYYAATLQTIAGTNVRGYNGDNQAATSAQLNYAKQLAINSYVSTDTANVYVADKSNHCVRKINRATGIITTVVGIPGSSGNPNTSNQIAASSTNLNQPEGLVFDKNGTSMWVQI